MNYIALLLTALFFCFSYCDAQKVKQNQDSTDLLSQDSLQDKIPRFEDYPATNQFSKIAKSVNLKSHPEGCRFRTVLREAFKKGPNFARHLIVVSHGCGTECQLNWVIDACTGDIKARFESSVGVAYKLNSNLIILNPPDEKLFKGIVEEAKKEEYLPYRKGCKTQYYLWNGKEFSKLKEYELNKLLENELYITNID